MMNWFYHGFRTFSPSYITCIAIYRQDVGAGTAGPWLRSLQLLDELLKQGLEANLIIFSRLFSVCPWPIVLRLLRGLRCDLIAQGAALKACAGSWRAAVQLLPGSNLLGTTAAMSACERAARWPQAALLLKGDVDVMAVNTALSACGKALSWRKALNLARRAASMGLRGQMFMCVCMF